MTQATEESEIVIVMEAITMTEATEESEIVNVTEAVAIFVPSHLRVLNVSREIMLFSRSLIEDLRFGTKMEVDGTMERITRICRKLKVSELLLQHITLQDVHDWSQCLSESEVQIVGITRAMIANPKVCAHAALRRGIRHASALHYAGVHR